MKQLKKLHFIGFFSLTIIVSSCGGSNTKLVKSFSINAEVSEERPLTNDERNIATRICYAYQSKSKNFRSSVYMGTSFKFSGKSTDCQKTANPYQINTTLKYDSSNNLAYVPPSTFDQNLTFNKKVQTDTSGYLASVCSKIIKNEAISNTISQQNVKVQISFFREGLDGFFLQYFNLQLDNTFKIDSAEKFKVRTQIDFTNDKILGMDEYYLSQKVCTSSFDKEKFSEYEQGFISQ